MSYHGHSAETGAKHQEFQAATVEISLMREAMRRADADWTESGAVSAETMEFIRSVRSLQS